MGPMRAACRFAQGLAEHGVLPHVERVQAELYGSLALTGLGHGTDRAVLLGLSGNEPSTIDPSTIAPTVASIRESGQICLAGRRSIPFVETRDLLFQRSIMFPPGAHTQHPNGLRLTACDGAGAVLEERTFFSIGGGFITEDVASDGSPGATIQPEKPDRAVPYPFRSAAELLETASAHSLTISELMLRNESALAAAGEGQHGEEVVRAGIDRIWQAMRDCIDRGILTEGILPGGLNVRRRARGLARRLAEKERAGKTGDPLAPLDWVTVY